MKQYLITPDLQTRESVMFAAGRAQFSVTRDGVTRYVKVECKRRIEGGYKRGTVPLSAATHVFISEKGYGTPRIATYYPPKPQFDTGRLFLADGITPDHPHVEALDVIVHFIQNAGQVADFDVQVESACGMCGRKLEDPVSVKRGIGPECANKPTGTQILHASAFGQQGLLTMAAEQQGTTVGKRG